MTSKLQIYQGAALALGDRKIISLTENRETRRALDSVWERDGVKRCLQMGLWHFASRSVQYDYSPSVEPPFGFKRAFNKPEDWVRTTKMCEDEFYKVPLLQYTDEAGFWYADLDTIYVSFVSLLPDYGMDFSKWPPNFTIFVELWFAWSICRRTTNSGQTKEDLWKDVDKALRNAKSTDAMDEATQFLPPGTWSTSRQGRTSRLDRGNRSRLIG
jgi:hypothetical protein